ncbi:M48 family metalloprotease [Candidatus Omnitrophota bacterium]
MKTVLVLLLGLSLFLSGCAAVYNPATEQKEIIFITTATEVSIGQAVSTKIAGQYKISDDAEKNNRVREIGKKIAAVSDRKDLVYKFYVIEDKDLNAFTSPGGHLYINSGVLDKSTDDELACVIGHETGHVAARHIAKKMQAQIGYDILVNIALHKAGLRDVQKAASVSYNLIMLGYSREDELLSDRLGVKYAHKAGYDAYAMISFLKKLKDSSKKNMGPVFLRSHPYVSDRIKMLEKEIPGIIDKADKKIEAASVAPVVSNKERSRKVMCPECRRIFPGATNYCPYDGKKLE